MLSGLTLISIAMRHRNSSRRPGLKNSEAFFFRCDVTFKKGEEFQTQHCFDAFQGMCRVPAVAFLLRDTVSEQQSRISEAKKLSYVALIAHLAFEEVGLTWSSMVLYGCVPSHCVETRVSRENTSQTRTSRSPYWDRGRSMRGILTVRQPR